MKEKEKLEWQNHILHFAFYIWAKQAGETGNFQSSLDEMELIGEESHDFM